MDSETSQNLRTERHEPTPHEPHGSSRTHRQRRQESRCRQDIVAQLGRRRLQLTSFHDDERHHYRLQPRVIFHHGPSFNVWTHVSLLRSLLSTHRRRDGIDQILRLPHAPTRTRTQIASIDRASHESSGPSVFRHSSATTKAKIRSDRSDQNESDDNSSN